MCYLRAAAAVAAQKGLGHDIATIQANYNPPQQPQGSQQLQRQQIQVMLQRQMVTSNPTSAHWAV